MGLTIVGLGREKGDLTLSAVAALKKADAVFLRTEKTSSAKTLAEHGVTFKSFDDLYDKTRSFSGLTKKIVSELRRAAKEYPEVVYAVDGAVSEDLSSAELVKKIKNVGIIEGVSKVSFLAAKCGLSGKGYSALSAYDRFPDALSLPVIIYDLDSKMLASAVKLSVFERVGEEVPVYLYIGGLIREIRSYEIDRFDGYDYSTALVIKDIPLVEKERFSVGDLYDILYVLRGENGCPWDRVQTKESIRENLIEESYELVDAINCNDDDKMLEEIGDVLMQVAFHTVFAEERGAFTRNDVVSALCTKLITRHTHVFGNDSAKDDSSALALWNKNKQKEKGYTNVYEYVSAVPKNFPACMRAEKTFKRAKSEGVKTCDCSPDDIKRLAEKLSDSADRAKAAGEFLYAAVALAKNAGVNAEQALADHIETVLRKLADLSIGKKSDDET